MFFDRAGAGMPPGMPGGGAGAFTSPGMNPNSLAALMAMGGGAPPPGLPPGASPAAMPPGAVPPGATGAPGAPDIMALLKMLSPEQIQMIMAKLGLGGGGGAPGGMPGGGPMPGMGPGMLPPGGMRY